MLGLYIPNTEPVAINIKIKFSTYFVQPLILFHIVKNNLKFVLHIFFLKHDKSKIKHVLDDCWKRSVDDHHSTITQHISRTLRRCTLK